MKTNYGELADRYTILQIKASRGHGEEVVEELKDIEKELGDIKRFSNILYNLNLLMWNIENLITDHIENKPDLESVGALYIALRTLNESRSREKNKLAEMYGGYQELKAY